MSGNPSVSVIMPVYNAARYVRKAVESILNQTAGNFEFIIINDHSEDNSEEIILSYKDERIVYYSHDIRKGVVQSLNRALESATAPYIAVMHADDIALNNRLEKQMKVLDEHPETAVVAGKSIFIDEEDQPIGTVWESDERTNSVAEIRKKMVWENCISHPTVMIRSKVVKQYLYSSSARHQGFAVEDYTLWLHVLADGYKIEKLQEPVLFYRVHPQSASSTFLRKKNPFLINYYTKKFFLQQRRQNKKLNSYDVKVQFTLYIDYIKAVLKDIKKGILQ